MECNILEKGLEYLLTILKRLKACKIDKAILINGSIIYRYDVENDYNESGHNHIFILKDTGEFYSNTLAINTNTLYNAINSDYNEFETFRKKNKIKPKERNIEFAYSNNILSVIYKLQEEIILKKQYQFNTPTKKEINIVMSYLNSIYSNSDNYLTIELNSNKYVKEMLDTITVEYRNFEIEESIVRVPFIKSFLFGLRTIDKVSISIGKYIISNNKDSLYIRNLTYFKNDILEIHSSIIINF